MSSTIPYVENATWTDTSSTIVTAAKLNVLEQGINDAHLMPAVRAYRSTNQSISNNTATAIALDSERYDQAGGASSNQHDTVTNNSRLTCRYAGVYIIGGNARFAANATGHRYAAVRLNGTTIIGEDGRGNAGASVETIVPITTLWALAVTDYVELVVVQGSGGSLNVEAVSSYSPEFWMTRVA